MDGCLREVTEVTLLQLVVLTNVFQLMVFNQTNFRPQILAWPTIESISSLKAVRMWPQAISWEHLILDFTFQQMSFMGQSLD